MTPFLVIAVIVGALVVVLVVRSNRRRDGVDSFRRQIDALSPEARRPVVDQVQSAADRDADDHDHDHDDDGGARGA